ncbi:unannotated protein [freshwater metagenome]|uniref:Unannotated protein n=1 Tax=freshwater metagenome TaxID=449393 RepID=A0A6J6RB15_9ZZZZ
MPVGGVLTSEHLDSPTADVNELLEVADLGVIAAAPAPDAVPVSEPAEQEPAEQEPPPPPVPPKPRIVSISTMPTAPTAQPGTKGRPGRGAPPSSSPPMDPGFNKR